MLFHTPTKHQLIPQAVNFVGTFIFLKVDVSDLTRFQIFEISAIAVHMQELCDQRRDKANFPRIIEKLNLCFDPFTAFNDHLSSVMKINRAMIRSACKRKFDKNAVQLLHLFLQRQAGQICFVCHNGFRWDFQVLQAALSQLGQNIDRINGQDVLCADTLWTFKVIDDSCLNSNFCLNNVNVGIFDMIFYTLNSVYSRYLKKQLPEQLSAEEKNISVFQLVYQELQMFLARICAKNFSLVKPMHVITAQPTIGAYNSIGSTTNVSNSNATDVFVFADIETTGLINPQITEICLIAVHKDSILASAEEKMPRIQDKLVLVIEPECAIEQTAARISGLTNALIQKSVKPPFDYNTAWTIAQFLQQQSGTICLVAHNGNRFDYPCIRRHLSPYISSLPVFSSIFSADSLPCLKRHGESMTSSQERISYKLQEVYKRYFPDANAVFHDAESDARALVDICCVDPDLLDHLDQTKDHFL